MIRVTINVDTTARLNYLLAGLSGLGEVWDLRLDYSGHTDVDDVYGDEPSDDEAAEDIHQLLSHDNGLSRKVDEIAAEHGVSRSVAVQVLGTLWTKPEVVIEDVDIAPPRGIARPSAAAIVAASQFQRPRVNGKSKVERQAKQACVDAVPCPKCGADTGRYCRAASTGSMGTAIVHADRLNLIQWRS